MSGFIEKRLDSMSIWQNINFLFIIYNKKIYSIIFLFTFAFLKQLFLIYLNYLK